MLQITEIINPTKLTITPIKEKQDIFIPNIHNKNVPMRNGFLTLLSGSPGSGKTNLLLNFFRDSNIYKKKFNNIFYFIPECSYNSIEKNPLAKIKTIYHELTLDNLQEVYNQLVDLKEEATKEKEKQKEIYVDDILQKEDDPPEIEYSLIIIDDFADQLKNKAIEKYLKSFMVKSRHLCVSFIVTLQSYFLCPKLLRKIINYAIIFKPKNIEEWLSISKELIGLSLDQSFQLYDYIYDGNYNHLDIDLFDSVYYKNFNRLEIVKEMRQSKKNK